MGKWESGKFPSGFFPGSGKGGGVVASQQLQLAGHLSRSGREAVQEAAAGVEPCRREAGKSVVAARPESARETQ